MMITREVLLKKTCRHQTEAVGETELAEALAALPDWAVEHGKLVRTFGFKDYQQTIAFVNVVATIANREDHHPTMVVSYNRCIVRMNTHSVNNGLSENDLICAAKFDDAFQQTFG